MFVYEILNNVNGKKYVGQHAGDNLQKYFERTVWLAINGYQGKRLLYRAIRKYGPEAFSIKPLIIVASKQEMDFHEIEFIKAWDLTNPKKGYNITSGGGGSLGVVMSEETRAKMSESRKGRKMSEENRLKLIERNTGNKYALGRKMTEEHFQKLLATHVGAKRSEDSRKKMSQAHLGTKQSEETKLKRIKALTGLKRSEETKRKQSEALKGNKSGSHVRWHVNKNVVDPSCYLCQAAA